MESKEEFNRIQEIAYKRFNGTATSEEIASYEKWYASFDDREMELDGTVGRDISRLGAELYAKLMVKVEREQRRPMRILPYLKWAGAAAVVLAVFIGYLVYRGEFLELSGDEVAASHQIRPGRNTATLKLADGQVIALKETKEGLIMDASNLIYTDGTGVSYNRGDMAEAKEMVLSTPKGGTYQVVLPDGSKVWLNALSSMVLSADFATSFDRHVTLNGEAYFEIAKADMVVAGKNRRRPFVVTVGDKQVEVLGTHFNVKNYAGEHEMKTTLLEGSVKVVAGSQKKIIVPGQQAVATDNQIVTANVDVEEIVAWKNGNFQFANEKIQNIMQEVGRWYNVEIVYQGSITQEGFGGAISRKRPITEVLASLEETGAVHFKIEGRRVIVMP